MLIVFGGLPGTGKTTVARGLAARRSATYLRIDTIEQAIRASSGQQDVGDTGYAVGNALALSNLAIVQIVIADCVNPVRESRQAWQSTARRAGRKLIEVELTCSDPTEHRRRLEQRPPEIEGLLPPTWQDILHHDYIPWPEPHTVIDTARISPADAIAINERLMDP